VSGGGGGGGDGGDGGGVVEHLVGAMTLDEKCSLTAGANLWYLPPVERLGIPALKSPTARRASGVTA